MRSVVSDVLDRLWRNTTHTLRAVKADRQGGILVVAGISLPVLFGLGGMGLDVGTWYLEKRVMQATVDAAALSATHALISGADETAVAAAIHASFEQNEFGIRPSDVLEINSPPLSGPSAGNPSAVEVVLTRKAELLLASLVVQGDLDIGARAVGGTISVGEHCIIGLDEEIDGALEFSGTADALINCGVASNSRSDRSILVMGNAHLVADPAQAFGDIYVGGNATFDTEHPPQPHAPRVPDPYAHLLVPAEEPCESVPNLNGSQSLFLDPGYYCDDIRIQNDTVVLNDGVYVINGGDFRVQTGSVVLGNNVTIILTGNGPHDVGEFEMHSNATVVITAPDSGPYAGVLLFQDSLAEPDTRNIVNGGADTVLKGALYTPTREITYTGGGGITSQCLKIVARKVTILGNTEIENNPDDCVDAGSEPISEVRIRLVE